MSWIIFAYTLACYGISSAIVYYSGPFGIIEKTRMRLSSSRYFSELTSCMFCLPVNIGILMSLVSMLVPGCTPFTPFTVIFTNHYMMWPLILALDGFYTGAMVSIIDTIVDRLSPDTIGNKDSIMYD